MVLIKIDASSHPKAETSEKPQHKLEVRARGTSARIHEACANVRAFRVPVYALNSNCIMPNRSYWRGFTKYGFIERGKLYAKWTVPLLIAVVWAAPRPYLWEKLSEIFYEEKEE
jgi:hypothetical protein